MALQLTPDEQQMLTSDATSPGLAMAMRIVVEAARLLGAERLVEIKSAHADGVLYHGDSGVFFAERLLAENARVAVPTTCNVGSVDLLHPDLIKGDPHHLAMGRRLMEAHVALGCQPTWTCAPYQAGHRPKLGEQVAWGESNAIAFVNSVLGARTNRYGDFLDLCCAITGRAPYYGLHLTENRRARIVFDVAGLSPELRADETFYPVIGAFLGAHAGDTVAAITGLSVPVSEDNLKALGAGAASTGAVGLFHVVGVTPEAKTLDDALQGGTADETIVVSMAMLTEARDRLGPARPGAEIDCLALGSPHFSIEECRALLTASEDLTFKVPVYVCVGRHVYDYLAKDGSVGLLEARGVTFVVDTCVVVTPILEQVDGVLMTNSAKFAHYARPNTGYQSVFGSLADCVASAAVGHVVRRDEVWR